MCIFEVIGFVLLAVYSTGVYGDHPGQRFQSDIIKNVRIFCLRSLRQRNRHISLIKCGFARDWR